MLLLTTDRLTDITFVIPSDLSFFVIYVCIMLLPLWRNKDTFNVLSVCTIIICIRLCEFIKRGNQYRHSEPGLKTDRCEGGTRRPCRATRPSSSSEFMIINDMLK